MFALRMTLLFFLNGQQIGSDETESARFVTVADCEAFYNNPDFKTFIATEKGRQLYQRGADTVTESHQCLVP